MFFRKKREESVYFRPPQPLTMSSTDMDSFSLPTFDEGPISTRIADRTNLICSKIENGDLDGDSADFIALAYIALDNELEAELDAYKHRCKVELNRIKYSLQDQASVRSALLEKGREAFDGLGESA